MRIRPNNMMSGKMAETLAYGFSGKRPYHFSRTYLRPWAVKIESGKMKKMMALELNPAMMSVKTISSDAIELREAKKPLVVEKRPINAIAKVGKLMSGARKILSTLVRHASSGFRPVLRLFQKISGERFLEASKSAIVLPLLMIFTINAARPEIAMRPVNINGIFGNDFKTKRRCG